jgi:hypothetical protein
MLQYIVRAQYTQDTSQQDKSQDILAGHKIIRQATRYHVRAQYNTVDTRFTAGHKKTWQTLNIMAGDQTTLADQIYHGRVRATMADIRCKGRAQDDNAN